MASRALTARFQQRVLQLVGIDRDLRQLLLEVDLELDAFVAIVR